MVKRHSEIVVDLSSLKLHGEVLDMGFEGKGIIYRALKQRIVCEDIQEAALTADTAIDIEDCNWVYGYPTDLPFKSCSFDTITTFFSLSCIKRKYMRNKAIKEVHRILKKNGKVHIWDVNRNILSISVNRELKVILPRDEVVKIEIGQTGYPGGFNLNSIAPVIERYFTISEIKNLGGHFYIEAIKRDENN